MTKAEIVSEIAKTIGIDKAAVLSVVEQYDGRERQPRTRRAYISVASVPSLSSRERKRRPATSAKILRSSSRLTTSRHSNPPAPSRTKSQSDYGRGKRKGTIQGRNYTYPVKQTVTALNVRKNAVNT